MKRVDEESWYHHMRWEHKKRRDTGYYAEQLGVECVNCGSNENVVYHHIVPLCAGGTNNLRNIVPLCSQCHKAVHGAKNRECYRNKELSGRPSTADKSVWNDVLDSYSAGKIGQSEALKLLNRSPKSHLVDSSMYKEYLNEHKMKKIKNLVDIKRHHHNLVKGEVVGHIEMLDGEIKEMIYEG